MEENTPTGRPIGDPVAADDDDVGDTLTYTLDDGADAGAFDIDELSGQLRTKTPLDYDEGKRSYSMTLTATDTSGEDDSIAVRVAVTNINEPPELSGPTAVDYDENNRGTVASYTAVDPERTTITWTLAGDDQDDFQISSRCVLTFSATPDYETPTDSGGNNTYEVTVQASDGTNTPTQAVTVSVINLDRGRHRHGHNNNQPPASGHRSGSHPRRPRPRNPKHAGAEIVADSAYASGAALETFDDLGHTPVVKPIVRKPHIKDGFHRDDFCIDTRGRTVTCPANHTVRIRPGGTAPFAKRCNGCPLRARCTTSERGRTITVDKYHDRRAANKARWAKDETKNTYRNLRPSVERTIAWLTRHKAKRVPYPGIIPNQQWLTTRTAAINLQRLINLGLAHTTTGWATNPA